MNKIKRPVMKCFFDGKLTTFHCPVCNKTHRHGIGEGHRSAHCDIGTPFEKTGYVLKYYTKKELKSLIKAASDMLKLYYEGVMR